METAATDTVADSRAAARVNTMMSTNAAKGTKVDSAAAVRVASGITLSLF
jgi:hypothetical protein